MSKAKEEAKKEAKKEIKKTYIGIKRLAKTYTITIPAARKALMAHKVMALDGRPVKPEFAKEGELEDGTPWYQWEEKVAGKAFKKAGYGLADEIDLLGHAQGRYQAGKQLDQCLIEIGSLSGIEKHRDSQDTEIREAVIVYFTAVSSLGSSMGRSWEIASIDSEAACAKFVNELNFGSEDYVKVCKLLAKNDKTRDKIDRYHSSIKKLSGWVQSQYFR